MPMTTQNDSAISCDFLVIFALDAKGGGDSDAWRDWIAQAVNVWRVA
jgi:hypothetical protein